MAKIVWEAKTYIYIYIIYIRFSIHTHPIRRACNLYNLISVPYALAELYCAQSRLLLLLLLLIWGRDRISIGVDRSCGNEAWSFRLMVSVRAERYFIALRSTPFANDTFEFCSNEATNVMRICFIVLPQILV